MSFNSNINPDVVATLLDAVWDQRFNGQEHPGHATALTSELFPVVDAMNAQYTQDEFAGVGAWEKASPYAEEFELPEGTPRIMNTKTTLIAEFDKQVWIPKRFMEDQMHSSYEKMVQNFARRAVTARDKNAFAPFRNAATTTLTADGVAWASASHTTKSGALVSNLTTSALTDTSLKAAIAQLYEQKALDDEIDGHVPAILLVSAAKFADALELTKSKQQANTANNNMNFFSESFSGMQVMTSPWLGNAAGGDDDDWFLLSADHSIQRFVRIPTETQLVDYIYDSKNRYCYKGRFREEVDVMSYEGSYIGNVA